MALSYGAVKSFKAEFDCWRTEVVMEMVGEAEKGRSISCLVMEARLQALER